MLLSKNYKKWDNTKDKFQVKTKKKKTMELEEKKLHFYDLLYFILKILQSMIKINKIVFYFDELYQLK